MPKNIEVFRDHPLYRETLKKYNELVEKFKQNKKIKNPYGLAYVHTFKKLENDLQPPRGTKNPRGTREPVGNTHTSKVIDGLSFFDTGG